MIEELKELIKPTDIHLSELTREYPKQFLEAIISDKDNNSHSYHSILICPICRNESSRATITLKIYDISEYKFVCPKCSFKGTSTRVSIIKSKRVMKVSENKVSVYDWQYSQSIGRHKHTHKPILFHSLDVSGRTYGDTGYYYWSRHSVNGRTRKL